MVLLKSLIRQVFLCFALFLLCLTFSIGQVDSIFNDVMSNYRSGNYAESTATLISMLDTLDESELKTHIKARSMLISIYCYIDSCTVSEPFYEYLSTVKTTQDTLDSERLNGVAYYLFNTRQYKEAIINYDDFYEVSRRAGLHDYAVKALVTKSMCQNYSDLDDESVNTLHFASRLLDSLQLSPKAERFRRFQINNEIGLALKKSKDFEKSNAYYFKALAIDSISERSVGSVKGNLVANYYSMGDYEQCITFAKEVVANSKTKLSTVVYALDDMIRSLIALGQVSEAAKYLKVLDEEIGDENSPYYKQNYINAKGNLLVAQGRPHQGIKYLRQAFDYVYAEYPESFRTKQAFAEEIMNAHYLTIDDKTFQQDFKHYKEAMDSIEVSNNRNEILKATIKYEAKIKQDSIDHLALVLENRAYQIRNQRISMVALLFGFLSTGLLAFLLRGRYLRSKEENEKLVFENQELISINQSLQKKMVTVSNPNITKVANTVKFKSLDKIYTIEHHVITHLEAESNGCRVHTIDKSYWTDKSLKTFKSELPDTIFVQVHRSNIVNLLHVEWVNHATLQLKNGISVKIGRTYKEDIKNAIK